jgi:hypothetical protein
MSEAKKCAHEFCTCVCTDGKKYCSQICEDSVGVQALKCDCKHPTCGGDTL